MNRIIFLPAMLWVISTNLVGAANAPSGYNVFACEVKTIALDEGHSLSTFSGKGVLVSTPGSPDHMASIECLGTIESMPDKSFKASGYCVVTDRDGDKLLDRWWADSTMPKGRWEDTGISGKWKGFRRTGSYVYTDRSTQTECRGVSNWEADR
jgi:hypothetical protein